jgi:hypothetical protein
MAWRRAGSASQISVGFRDQIDYEKTSPVPVALAAIAPARERRRFNLITRQGTMIAFWHFNARLHELRCSGIIG